MCNLYSITTNQAAIIALFRVVNRYVGNLAPMPGVFPDYQALIVRNGAEGRELATARWGMPCSQHALMEATKKRAAKLEANEKPVDFKQLLGMEPAGGTTNIHAGQHPSSSCLPVRCWQVLLSSRCATSFQTALPPHNRTASAVWISTVRSQRLQETRSTWR
jgi:hypothetical protein